MCIINQTNNKEIVTVANRECKGSLMGGRGIIDNAEVKENIEEGLVQHSRISQSHSSSSAVCSRHK